MRVSIIGNQHSEHSEHALAASASVRISAQRPAVQPAPLRLALHGLADEEASVLVAILRVLSERTAQRWVLSDEPSVDLLLSTRAASADAPHHVLGALLLREDDLPAAPDQLALQVPLRVMSVLDLLNSAHDRLRQARAAATPITQEHQAIEVDDGKSLAAALSRQIERRPDNALRVRIVGHGTLYLCLKTRIYHVDFPREHLADALNEHRFVMTLIPATSAELVVLHESAWPVDEALWLIGLASAADASCPDSHAYRLTRWPDFARLAHRPDYMKTCAAMSRTHQRIDALAQLAGMRRMDVEHLLHACALCGYLDIVAATDAPLLAAAPARGAIGGLFDRLRRRFGL